jgi:sigma-B regulation protein RsbU (phosphoserine phosphatase)
MGLPILAMASGGYKTGVAIQYIAMMMSVILIFAFVFSDNEKDLFSTNKELGLATNIQKHMLPSIFPAFPDRKEFDVFASMTPAKEVGGDFYDFFLIDEDHLGLVMADVSDKGVPAALFMMASKIMVQNYAMMGKKPSEVLTAVNNQICQNNQDEMFVTIWLGILDLKTGILTASNAGHEKPAIKNPNGKFDLLQDKHGFVVGWYKNVKYTDYEIKLEKGSKIFLYTDGVPEASSGEGQFSRERMVKTLNKYRDMNPEEIVKNVKDDIDLFVGHEDQFDDITMLCVEFKGYENE